jgi:hypothetical protein
MHSVEELITRQTLSLQNVSDARSSTRLKFAISANRCRREWLLTACIRSAQPCALLPNRFVSDPKARHDWFGHSEGRRSDVNAFRSGEQLKLCWTEGNLGMGKLERESRTMLVSAVTGDAT